VFWVRKGEAGRWRRRMWWGYGVYGKKRIMV
jgi:hypothetical protein